MRILITNGTLRRRSGTECYAMELGVGLRDRGHEVVFFSPRLGATAKELVEWGFQVTDCLSEISNTPDVIHGQHTVPALRAACAFPNAPLLYICHDALSASDAPTPEFITDEYAAVDQLTQRRIVDETGVSKEAIKIFGNVVDTGRFACREIFNQSPKRALIYSGSTKSLSHFEAIRAACAKMGLRLDEAGERANGFFDQPEALLPNYDIVFCKARCAMEAMATGAYVVLIGDNGMGPAITLSNIEDLRLKNFGREALIHEFFEERIRSRIEAYDSEEARRVSEWARVNLSQEGWLGQVETVYLELSSVHSKRESMRVLPDGARLEFKDWRLRMDLRRNQLKFVQLRGAGKIVNNVRSECRRFFQKLKT